MTITWLGHASFLLESGGYHIVLDPCKGVPGVKDTACEAEAVYCSHGHFDHCYTDEIRLTEGKTSPFTLKEIAAFHDEANGAKRGPNTIRLFTAEGITAIQMDLKNKGLTMEIIADALERCRVARLEILNEVMLPCISEPRAEVSEYAPKMLSLKIPVEKIREVIGSGGKTIQKICAETGAKVDIDDDGSVFISAVDANAAYAAKKMVDDICFVPEVGKLYYGKVVRILPIGAFVEIAPGHDGMVHISKLENRRVEKVEDVLNLGDMTWVKFMGFDEKGRANFSRKDALKEMAEQG